MLEFNSIITFSLEYPLLQSYKKSNQNNCSYRTFHSEIVPFTYTIMKIHHLLFFASIFFIHISLFAQDSTPLTTENSVGLRLGFFSAYEDLFSNAKHGTNGPISLSFTTKAPSSLFRYGAEVQYSKITRELKENDLAYLEAMHTIGVMPHIDVVWLNTEFVKVSASGGLGIGMSFANS